MEGVSAFIVGTCQIHPKKLHDASDYMQLNKLYPVTALSYSFPCGSSAEFYIKPINSCVDDMDLMRPYAKHLGFTEDIPVLPDDLCVLRDTMECEQIMQNPEYPGFVELRHLGQIRYDWHCKQFNFHKTNDLKSFVTSMKIENFVNHKMVGPALKFKELSQDIVPCLWCPQWPKEAKNWPLRRRNYGWPNIINIRNVVQNGCHVVFAKHPACRNDERQCRLSFSGAELCLIRSLNPVQQIVYHMLRFFAKRELIKKDCPKEDEVLCTYHIKTLMLWICEQMSPEWWNSTSVIQICCNLLRKLSEWLRKGCCPNYFIPQANLFHAHMNQKIIDESIRRLNEFSSFNRLNGWFAEKYIKPVLVRALKIGDKMEALTDFGHCLLRICEVRDAGKLKNFDQQFAFGFWVCYRWNFYDSKVERCFVSHRYTDTMCFLRDCQCETLDRFFFLKTVEFSSSFPHFGKVVFILYFANELGFQKATYDSDLFTEFIKEITLQSKVVRSGHHDFPKPSKTSLGKSDLLFLKAEELMENLSGLNSPQEFKLVSQLSKDLLRNAINSDKFMSSAIRGVAFVYLAALHFSESDYEIVIDLSSTVFINKTRDNDNTEKEKEKKEEDEEKETMNAGCLYHIDDVARIIGFYLIFRRIKVNFQHNRRHYRLDLRLTPAVFAHYLIISSTERRHRVFRLKYDFQKSTFPLDAILMTLTNRKFFVSSKSAGSVVLAYQRTAPIDKLEAVNYTSFAQLLLEYSLEIMTTYYNAICKDFDIRCSAVDCYRAAYLYKCRKYPEVLQLCERILNEPDLCNDLKELAVANVMVMPPLDAYFDRDVRCLLGFHTLVYYLSPSNEDLRKIDVSEISPLLNIERTNKSAFEQFFARQIYFEKQSLSRILGEPCIVKCHYFLRRQFLARYLKVRCLIDCNHSTSEILLAFKKLNSRLPFEHIILCFLRQILRRID